ncbi:hypothetical protein NDU88_004435 [Pleurodeles waltl]|uniref:Uncharacterized protein n=1 Tax=Pleurodeles waltl TaxID=8319 RepID=A0AAV7T8S1_PLEWA|nr:hypothetical protein NDU88_004435 [Pleurodeles waltl]
MDCTFRALLGTKRVVKGVQRGRPGAGCTVRRRTHYTAGRRLGKTHVGLVEGAQAVLGYVAETLVVKRDVYYLSTDQQTGLFSRF